MGRSEPSFNLQGTYDTHTPSNLSSFSSSPSPQPQSNQPQSNQGRPIPVKTKQGENEALAALFENREGGQDTFGNIGALRCAFRALLINYQNTEMMLGTDIPMRERSSSKILFRAIIPSLCSSSNSNSNRVAIGPSLISDNGANHRQVLNITLMIVIPLLFVMNSRINLFGLPRSLRIPKESK